MTQVSAMYFINTVGVAQSEFQKKDFGDHGGIDIRARGAINRYDALQLIASGNL